ncbi:MAG: hypothetical protein KL785_07520 [Brevundimonas sp.]|nr:hypothetical protein [Brevundimonas sp.]
MIEAVKIWNEPNNKSHWDPLLDPEWDLFANMTRLSGQAIAAENPDLTRVLGGMSPIDASFLRRLEGKGALDHVDAVAVHGFPLDWNLWPIDAWPEKVAEIRAVTDKPVWVTEVGVSSFGSEEVQAWGVKKSADLLIGQAPPHPLVQPLRSAPGLGGDDPAQGGRGLVLLPAFPHGAAARGRLAQAGARSLCALCGPDGPVPVVPLRRPPARRRRGLVSPARRAPCAHRPVVGRPLS